MKHHHLPDSVACFVATTLAGPRRCRPDGGGVNPVNFYRRRWTDQGTLITEELES